MILNLAHVDSGVDQTRAPIELRGFVGDAECHVMNRAGADLSTLSPRFMQYVDSRGVFR